MTAQPSLDPLDEQVIDPPEVSEPEISWPREAPIDRNFYLRAPQQGFEAEQNASIEADGAGLSRFGSRLRNAIAKVGDIGADEVPLGLIRHLEAASVDDEHNIRQLASIQSIRTSTGIMHGALLHLHVPLVDACIINGRKQAVVQAEMAKAGLRAIPGAVDSTVLRLPCLKVDSADQVLEQSRVARHELDLLDRNGEQKDFLDQLSDEGVKVPPLIVPFQIDGGDEGRSWSLQAVDGARRTTGSQELVGRVTGASGRLSNRYWSTGKGSYQLRDMAVADIAAVRSWLTFPNSEQQGLFPSAPSTRRVGATVISGWLRDVAARSPEVRSFHRVRTYHAMVIFHVEPFDSDRSVNPVWEVVYDAIAQRHNPKVAPQPWEERDLWALYAMDLLERLCGDGKLTEEAYRALLNPHANDLVDRPVVSGRPYRNLLVAIADLVGKSCLDTCEDLANKVLEANKEKPSTASRGKMVAMHARLLLPGIYKGREGKYKKSQLDSIVATIASLSKDDVFYLSEKHPLDRKWPSYIHLDPAVLLDEALGELVTRYNQASEHRVAAGPFGPHQRALGFLAALALTVNPVLVQLNENLTRTGRGGRGRRDVLLGRQDPAVLIRKMMSTPEGLRTLEGILKSTTSPKWSILEASPGVPLTETYLRDRYLPKIGDGPDRGEFDDGQPPEELADESVTWQRHVDSLERAIADLGKHVAEMESHKLTNSDGDTEIAYKVVGIYPDNADRLKAKLASVTDFVTKAGVFAEASRALRGGSTGRDS
ncbi:hypothetical protein D5S17_23840 [Pseudonocardiaceae bacterium YIM PH 21723]|nr:hypothetical protein D5S17_23840 [Pseudonocardiaceae bacterium YIM PH 21723]